MEQETDQRSTLEKLAIVLDRQLLKIIRDGTPVFDCRGEPVLGANGKQLRKRPSAAYLNAATLRLKQAGVKGLSHDTLRVHGEMTKIMRSIQEQNRRGKSA